MSLSPCYPEGYDWGTAVVPRSPEGIYKPLWQAQDVLARPRVYPATWMQCAGFIAKGDHWDAGMFDAAMTYLNTGLQWAPFIAGGIRLWDKFVNLYNALHAVGYISFPYYWDVLWVRFWDPSLRRWYWTQSRIQSPNTSIRLDTGATYLYPSAPWVNEMIVTKAIAISNGSVFGNCWDNPL